MELTGIETLAGTRWAGSGELWLDPLGNDAATYECTLKVKPDAVEYTWTYDGDEQRDHGVVVLHKPDDAPLTQPRDNFGRDWRYSFKVRRPLQ